MNKFKIAAILLATVFVSACAQQEEPAPVVVEPEPVYDKYGNPV